MSDDENKRLDDVVKLVPLAEREEREEDEEQQRTSETAIKMLEAGLEVVRNSGALGVALVIVLPDGSLCEIKPHMCPDFLALIAGLDLLRHKLINRVVELGEAS